MMTRKNEREADRHARRLMAEKGKVSGGRKLRKHRLVKKFWKAVDNYNLVRFGEL